jgi:hypothetical protein
MTVFVKAKPKQTGFKIKPKKTEKQVNRPSLIAQMLNHDA